MCVCAHAQQLCKQQQKVRDHLPPIHTHNAVYLRSEIRFCLTESGNADRGHNTEEPRRHDTQIKTFEKEQKLCDRAGETFLHCDT